MAVEKGRTPYATTNYGETGLKTVTLRGHREIVELGRSRGATPLGERRIVSVRGRVGCGGQPHLVTDVAGKDLAVASLPMGKELAISPHCCGSPEIA